VLVCGVFISRCALAAFVKSDFGLYGVVGGMTVITLSVLRRGRCAAELPLVN